jgi:bacillithiol synthase
MNALFIDFIENRESVRDLYPQEDRFLSRSVEHRKQLCDILKKQNEAYGNPSTTSLINKLAGDDTSCVITGQQVGLLSGPMLSIWKNLTAIRTAKELEKQPGIRCVPIFWMASEDHNLHEVVNFALLKEDFNLLRFSLHDHLFLERRPTGSISVQSEEIRKILLRAFREIKIPAVKEFYAQGTLTEAFAKTLLWIFRDYEFLLVDPSDPDLKRLASPFFRRFFERSETLLNDLAEQNKSLQRRNLPVQVKMEEDQLPLFYLNGEERIHWRRNQKLQNVPVEKLSPSALLRPLFQDYIFPTVVYIGGPAEIAYFAQLHPWYDAMDLQQPALKARFSITLLPASTVSFLNSRSLQPHELFYPEDTLMDALIQNTELDQIKRKARDLQKLLSEHLNEMKAQAERIEPTLRKTFETAERKMNYQLQKIEKKSFFAAKRKNFILAEQIRKAKNVVYPDGKLQERYLNIFSFSTKLPDLIQQIDSKVQLDAKGHQWIVI